MHLGKDVCIAQGNPTVTLAAKACVAHVEHVVPKMFMLLNEWE